MDYSEIKKRIKDEEDFIYSPKYNNSLKEFIKQNPDGASDEKIFKYLLIDSEEFSKLLKSAYNKLRKIMER